MVKQHSPSHCTVVLGAVAGVCGKPAVWSNGTYAECAECVKSPLTLSAERTISGPQLGDKVDVHRYGKIYEATVVEVGKRGAVYAEFTYGNGATRRVRV